MPFAPVCSHSSFPLKRSTMKHRLTLVLFTAIAVLPWAAATPDKTSAQSSKEDDKTDKAKPGFKGSVDLVNVVQAVSNFSGDKQAATVIFRNLTASVGGVKGGSPVDTRVLTIDVPLQTDVKKDARVWQIIRGISNTQSKGRVALIIRTGGKTTTVNLDKAKTKDDNFQYQFESTVPAGVSLRTTFVLMADRDGDAPESGGVLTIDSLDLSLEKPKYKKP